MESKILYGVGGPLWRLGGNDLKALIDPQLYDVDSPVSAHKYNDSQNVAVWDFSLSPEDDRLQVDLIKLQEKIAVARLMMLRIDRKNLGEAYVKVTEDVFKLLVTATE